MVSFCEARLHGVRRAGGAYIGRRGGAFHSARRAERAVPRVADELQVCCCVLGSTVSRRRVMCVRARASVCACALLLALVVAEHDKRTEMSPMPFLMATRYGRSSPSDRHLSPRNDRFFMSTRYGKRSEGLAGTGVREATLVRGTGGAGGALLCQFTGVFPLYRCRHKPPQYHKRSAEETRED